MMKIPDDVTPIVKTVKLLRKGDALDETTSLLAHEIDVGDTEQLVFLILVRHIASNTDVTAGDLFFEVFCRAVISFITHRVLALLITTIQAQVDVGMLYLPHP